MCERVIVPSVVHHGFSNMAYFDARAEIRREKGQCQKSTSVINIAYTLSWL